MLSPNRFRIVGKIDKQTGKLDWVIQERNFLGLYITLYFNNFSGKAESRFLCLSSPSFKTEDAARLHLCKHILDTGMRIYKRRSIKRSMRQTKTIVKTFP